MNQTRPAGRKPASGTTRSRWRARHRSRSGLPRKGAVAVRRALGAASLPRPVPSRSDRPREGARPGARRDQRWSGHDVRHGVMPPWPASAGRYRSDAVPRSSASRATGARPGQPGGRGWSADAVGLPARLWSPGVRLGSLARRCPPVRRWVRAGGPSPRAQPPSTVPTASRGLPSPAHRTSDGPAAGYACTSRTVPREGPRAQPPSASAAGRHDGTTVVMLQDGKPRRATGLGLPATADHRNALLVRSKALKSHRTRWHWERNLETTRGQRLAVTRVRLYGWGRLWRVWHRRGSPGARLHGVHGAETR
jgi:hypothetical protein